MRLLYEIHVTIHVPDDLHLTDSEFAANESELIVILERSARDWAADTGLQFDVDVNQ